GIAHLRPGYDAAFDDELGLYAEKRRVPQHKTCELAGFDRTDFRRHAGRNRGVDRVFRDVTADAHVVVVALFAGQPAALPPHLVSRLPCARDHFAHTSHGLAVARDHADGTEIVEDVFGGNRFLPDAALGERDVLRDVVGQMMA